MNNFKDVDAALVRRVSTQFILFHQGPAQKATKKDLGLDLAVDLRLVEEAVYALRQEFMPIAADGGGYWLASSPEELDAVLRSLRRRLGKVHRTYTALEHAREKMIHELTVEPSGQRRVF